MSGLDRASIDALDSGHMLDDILAMPEQLGDAVWRVESAAIEPVDTPGGLVVAGMGGSAIGGALARAALGDAGVSADPRGARLRPAAVDDARHDGALRELQRKHRGDARLLRVGGALGARRIVVTSGGRLAELARAEGDPVIGIPGGFQPRAAIAYLLVSALEVAALCGAGRVCPPRST